MIAGVDVGTSGVKVTRFDLESRSLTEERHPYPFRIRGDFVDVSSLATVVQRIVSGLLHDPEVEAVGLTSMAPVHVMLDREMNPLVAFHYSSTLGADLLNYPEEEIRAATLNPSSSQMLPHRLLWLRKERANVYHKVSKVVDLNGYIFGVIAGERLEELVQDKITAFEWGTFRWPSIEPWGEFLDGDLHLLPPLVSPEHWVELYGKALSIGTVDSVAAALGSVGIEGKEGFASMGSTLCLGVPSRSPSKVPGIYNDLYFDDLFLPNGCNSQFSDVLDKVRELLGEDIDVENVDLRPGLPLLLPFLKGERSPFMDPKAAGVLFGLSWETSRSDVMRAAVHSMAYMEAMMISTLQSESEFNSVRSGGGASFSSLLRLCASLTGIPHFKLRYSPSSLGAALVAGNSIGTLTYRRITEVLPEPSSKIDPDPSLSSHLEYYRLFQSLYYTLRPLFRGP